MKRTKRTWNITKIGRLAASGMRQEEIAKTLGVSSGQMTQAKQSKPEVMEALTNGWQAYLDKTGNNIFPVSNRTKTNGTKPVVVGKAVVGNDNNVISLGDGVAVKFTYKLDGDIFTLNADARTRLTNILNTIDELRKA